MNQEALMLTQSFLSLWYSLGSEHMLTLLCAKCGVESVRTADERKMFKSISAEMEQLFLKSKRQICEGLKLDQHNAK